MIDKIESNRALLKVIVLAMVFMTFLQEYLRLRFGIRVVYLTQVFEFLSVMSIYFFFIAFYRFNKVKLLFTLVFVALSFLFGSIGFSPGSGYSISTYFFPAFLSFIFSYSSAVLLFKEDKVFLFCGVAAALVVIDFSFVIIRGGDITGEVFRQTSYNYTSSVLIFSLVALTAVTFYRTEKVLVWPALLCFAFSALYFSDARASLAISSIFLGVCAFLKVSPNSFFYRLMVFISIIVLIYLSVGVVYEFYVQTRFYTEGLQSIRFLMWEQYFNRLNVFNLFFGVELASVPLIREFNLNPHNSYIRLHAALGFSAIIIMSMFVFKVSKAAVKGYWFLIFLFILLVSRASTDIMIFPGMLSLPFLLVFLSLSFRR